MPVWKCTSCGFEFKGNCRPKECPDCKGPKDGFGKIEEKAAKKAPPKKAPAKSAKKVAKKK